MCHVFGSVNMNTESWGRYPKSKNKAQEIAWKGDRIPVEAGKSILPYGKGRSYGDSCLNQDQVLLSTSKLDRFISFDANTGVISTESGVTLEQIINLVVPHGWFLPVVPGTKFVTVGGAVANDVHGKNHHRVGSFGNHVLSFVLRRSDCAELFCSEKENANWYSATIGGLGLTGLITEVTIQLKKISNPWIDSETIKFKNLDELSKLIFESDKKFEYSVSWIDTLQRGASLGRGHLIQGNHNQTKVNDFEPQRQKLKIPFDMPQSLLNGFTVGAFNSLYYHRQIVKSRTASVPLDSFFFPLDGIANWNRLYGKAGFLQYQCLVPLNKMDAIKEVLERVAISKKSSFLSVLKIFGNVPSVGMLSFPKPGITLTLDFAYQGQSTLALLDQLDQVVHANGGSLYPAKDARMSAAHFKASFVRWNEFEKFIDPNFSSSFWRRVVG
jgi:FAD/FMN-containing dehydrogenase